MFLLEIRASDPYVRQSRKFFAHLARHKKGSKKGRRGDARGHDVLVNLPIKELSKSRRHKRSADVCEKCAIIQEPELQYVGIFTFFVKRLSERNFSQYFTKPVVNLVGNLSQVSSRVKFEADTY